MDKEEALQISLDKINKGNTTQIQFCYKVIYELMDEYAAQQSKQEAIAFAEWINEATDSEQQYFVNKNPYGIKSGYYTANQLWELYLKSKTQ